MVCWAINSISTHSTRKEEAAPADTLLLCAWWAERLEFFWGIFSQFFPSSKIYDSQNFRLLVARTQNYFSLCLTVFVRIVKEHAQGASTSFRLIELNTHIVFYIVKLRTRTVCGQSSRAPWDCEGFFLLPASIITPEVAILVIVSPSHTFKRRSVDALIHKRLNHTTIYDVKSVILIFYYTFATCFYSKERKSYFMVSLIEVVKK